MHNTQIIRSLCNHVVCRGVMIHQTTNGSRLKVFHDSKTLTAGLTFDKNRDGFIIINSFNSFEIISCSLFLNKEKPL